jgi:uncharacterized protein YegL
MPDIRNDFDETPRKDLHVFYVLDTSGSMEGTKISTLNRAMEESIQALSDTAKSNGDAKLKIAVMEFNSGCKWVTSNGPEDLESGDFIWDPLKAGGLTDIGAALTELNSKLSRKAFLNCMVGAMMPIIIFMTDGYATDNYEKALAAIRGNRWFQYGTKIGFAVGDDADLKMISSVVGNSEAVIRTTDLNLFKKLLRFVSVTASKLVSESTTTGTAPTAADIVKDVIGTVDEADPSDVTVNLPPSSYNPEPTPAPAPIDWDDGDW